MGQEDFYESRIMGHDAPGTPIYRIERDEIQRLRGLGFSPKRVLDLGCGSGHGTMDILHGTDAVVVGADVSATTGASFTSLTGFEFVHLSAESSLPFDDSEFDLILLNDVIEHVADTDLMIREIGRILTPHGRLILSTPNLASWFNRLALAAGIQPAFSEVSYEGIFGRPGFDVVGHLRLFTRKALIEFLQHHGFKVLRIQGCPFPSLPRYLHGVDALMGRKPSLAAGLIVTAALRNSD